METGKAIAPPGKWQPQYEPAGVRFTDGNSGKLMMLVTDGAWLDWLCYWNGPSAEWVSLRKISDEERASLLAKVLAAP